MQHDLIPERNAAIVEALRAGATIAGAAHAWGLAEATIKQIARGSGLTSSAWTLKVHPDHYKPSAQAQAVLDEIGHDLNTLARRGACNDRDKTMIDRWLATEDTLDTIGADHGITRERVRQIVKKHTGLDAALKFARRAQVRESYRRAESMALLEEIASKNPDMSVREIRHHTGLSREEIIGIIGEADALRRGFVNRDVASRHTIEEVLAEMCRIASQPDGTPLSTRFYDEHRSESFQTAQRVIQIFDTWSNACEVAGVIPAASPPRQYSRTWDKDDCIDWARRYVDEVGIHAASFQGLTRWLRQHQTDGAPSSTTIRVRAGRWNSITARIADLKASDGSLDPNKSDSHTNRNSTSAQEGVA